MSTQPPDTPNEGNWTPSLSGHAPEARPLRPCVVLTSLERPVPEPLHQALHEADLAPRVEHDPRMAMAEVCLLRREMHERAAIGVDEDAPLPPLVLLGAPTDAQAVMVDTLQRMVPDVPVLMLVGNTLGELDPPFAGTTDAPALPDATVVPDEIESLLGRPTQEHA